MSEPPDVPADISFPAALPAADNFRPILWSILLAGASLRLYLMFYAHSTHEDFYITLRYAENIAAGHGIVYNDGHRVLGTTTPLYTLILALFARLGLNPTLCGKLLGICADTLAGLFTYSLGKTIGRPVAGLAAAVCMAFAPVNLTWATKGMEVGIVAAVAAGAWLAWAEKREVLAWSAAAMLVLLRIDGAALAAIMLLATVLRDRRIPWRGLVIFVLLVAPWAVFAAIYFGSPIPLSASAKLLVYGRMIPGHFPQLPVFLAAMFHNPFGKLMGVGCLFYVLLAGASLRRRRFNGRTNRDRVGSEISLGAPLIWIVMYYAAMALSHVVLFGWYFVPPTPIYYLVAMVGFSMAAERIGSGEKRASFSQITLAIAAAATLIVLTTAPRVAKTLRDDQAVETNLRIPIGIWMRDHARPNDTLMLEPIGYIGYYSRLKIIDMIGLVSPESLPSYSADVPCPSHDLWTRLRPDWLLLRGGELTGLEACEKSLPPEQRLGAAYTEVKSWQNPVNPSGKGLFYLFRRNETLKN